MPPLSTTGAEPSTPSKLALEPATSPRNLQALKRLNSLLLPIPYSTKFYTEIASSPSVSDLTRVALYDTAQVVGAIRGRLEPDGKSIYIMTLCTLSPFRRLGVATLLLQWVLGKAREWGVESVWAHVWQENEDAMDWYRRRGFEVGEVEGGYYRKLRPDGARVVRLYVKRETGVEVNGKGAGVKWKES